MPPAISWYRIAKEAVNQDDYVRMGHKYTETPDLDDLSYLEPKLRESWEREQANLKAKKAEQLRLAKQKAER